MITAIEKEELKKEILEELTSKKKEDSAWKQAKKGIKDEVARKYGIWESFRIVDAAATIARMMWNRTRTTYFNNSDIEAISNMMYEMLEVAEKYSQRREVTI